ncbi:hypothetical protein ACR1PO_12540 [Chryseobacterium sp. RRHN12]|uniref:hypothetical protein n=1 Tax=Chryseobacterium sp. RRHN12 TaxID=3437884 RepID=UPI003D9B9136
MQKNSKIIVLLMAVLSLTACEVEREVLKASHEPNKPAGETFNGKKIIKQGTPEYDLVVKNGVDLDFQDDSPGSPLKKLPEKAFRNASTGKIFELPTDVLYGWGINTANLQKLTVFDGCPGFENFGNAQFTAKYRMPAILIPREYQMYEGEYRTYLSERQEVVKYGENWWSFPQFDGSGTERYVYKNTLKGVLIKIPNSATFLTHAYDTRKGEFIWSNAAYGYYLQDGMQGGDFKNEFLTKTFKDGYFYNFGVWKDIALMYGTYENANAELGWDFMDYNDVPSYDFKEFVKQTASKEPYKSWHPGLKSKIQGQYMDGENVSTYTNVEGDLIEIKSDMLENVNVPGDATLTSEFNEQEEETITTGSNTENKFIGGVTLTYEVSAGLAGLFNIKANTAYNFEYQRTNTTTESTSNRKLKWYKTSVAINVPRGKKYLIQLFSYRKQIDINAGGYLKVFQKLFKDKNNFHVPPFISLNQSTWEPLINVPLRVFASKSGLANGYKNRYLYTGIDYSIEPQNNINAYDLLYMGDSKIKIITTGNMRKKVTVTDVTDPTRPRDVTSKANINARYN